MHAQNAGRRLREVARQGFNVRSDGFDPESKDAPFGASFGANTEEDEEREEKRKEGTGGQAFDEVNENNKVYDTGWDPYVVLDISPMDDIDEDALRAAFRKLAKKFHPDVPKTGSREKFDDLRRAVEELSSLNMLGLKTWNAKVPHLNQINRPERGQTVSEDFWELRGRDFFAELETELTDDLRRGFNESDLLLTNDQLKGRLILESGYWEERENLKVDLEIGERAEEWKKGKLEERKLLIRERLRGGGSTAPRQISRLSFKPKSRTFQIVQVRVAQWLGIPDSMVLEEMSLVELGFFDEETWDDLAGMLMLLEEDFRKSYLIELASQKRGLPPRVDLPKWVVTLSDFACFIDAKI